ncbi:MAG: O-Antigen ligase [Firmicutes bacterium ADurb.Bin300]|nr:MAG: O-Antigen ligase [Firmicutes bacterium ADurb.Bin300]
MSKKKKRRISGKGFFKPYKNPVFIALLLLTLFSGGFQIYACTAVSSFFLIYLAVISSKNSGLKIYFSLASITVAVFALSYLITSFWAVNGFGAVMGFFKFLPVLLFTLILFQKSDEEKRGIFMYVPFSGVILTVITAPLYFLSLLKDRFYEYGRLHGGFGYANAFALFLLAGIVILFYRSDIFPKKWQPYVLTILLSGGIFLSGSRTVFVLLALTLAYFSVKIKNVRKYVLPAFIIFIGAAAAYALITDNTENISRFLTSFTKTDTIRIRPVYWKDALPVIFKHPFGTGYEGYSYMQLSFQSASYSNTYLHNDYLQILFDIGFIPAALFIATVLFSFFSKRTGGMEKTLIFIICAHLFFDFDLQFLSVFLILILCFDYGNKNKTVLKKKTVQNAVSAFCVLLSSVNIWFFMAAWSEYRGNYETALKLNPALTYSQIMVLRETTSKEKAKETAEHILSQNGYVTVAYDALSLLAASEKDFSSAVQYSRKAISTAKYIIEEYENYFSILQKAYVYCGETGDTKNTERYRNLILEIPDMIDDAKATLNPKAYEIGSAEPDLELSADTLSYIFNLRQAS